MDIPRFDQRLKSASASENPGDAFQVFIHELLTEDYPGLHFFKGGGRDGGIDLVQSLNGRRVVVECKYVGADGLPETRRRWLEVAGHLQKHLSDATGPTHGQAQYAPWYGTDLPIREYVFCVSSELGNLRQADELRQEITDFFAGLSVSRGHLAHLSGLSVKVLDWNDIKTLLLKRPHLLFRWFKLTRHYGLVTLDEVPDYTTFRSYLFGDRLPYYSRRQHLTAAPAPPGAGILDEHGLLGLVEGGPLTGLVLTGGGGVGKTRLTLELGWLAQDAGWVVLRVLRRLKEDALTHLARWITPETKVLLLIDYVETQSDFAELVDVLNDLNDSVGLRLRYAANCRASYYSTIATTERHREVNLSPVAEVSAAAGWFESYQQQTVRHILEHSGIEVTERHLEVCRDVPVLAVFMSYLRGSGRQTDLESLLEEQDFSRWIVKRLQLSFGDATVSNTLAQLVALFPLPAAASQHAELKEHEVLFGRLAIDRWIERLPADETRETDTWVTAHDVLADQILLSYFKSNPYTVENFVRGLLSLARRIGCLRSALITLQRLVDKPALGALDWPKILDGAIAEDPPAWRGVRDILVRTSLLKPLQTIDLLGRHEEVWRGAEEEAGFQLAVGWHARWVLRQEGLELDEAQRTALQSWLGRTAGHATVSNYALTSGVKFCPDLVRDAALSWIRSRPRHFQTHYLMVAWLEQELPTEDIAPAVEQWSAKFAVRLNLSFIARAWLNAKGDKELLRAPIRLWLAEHGALPEASFVYQSWLDAGGGGTETIRTSLPMWLAEHGALPEAKFVYKSWLDAGGDPKLIQEYLPDWLDEHGANADASFVYQSWLDAGGGTEIIRTSLPAWLAEHGALPEASFVYQSWLDAGGDPNLIQEYLLDWLDEHGANADARFVYKSWLDAGGDPETLGTSLPAWLAEHGALPEASFVYQSWLDAGGGTETIRESLMAWLAEHATSLEAQFVYSAWLGTGGSFSVIRSQTIQWLRQHYEEEGAGFLIKYVAKQSDIPVETVKDILNWCRMFPTNEDAIWRLTQLRKHLLIGAVAEDVCAVSEAVLNPSLATASTLSPVLREQITTLLSYLIGAPGLRGGRLRGRVDELLVRWLRHPSSYGDFPRPHWNIQRYSYAQRVAALVGSGALSVSEDREALRRFMRWLDNWDMEEKLTLRPLIAELERTHPAPGLWDIVKFG
jgi:hypothetical protein